MNPKTREEICAALARDIADLLEYIAQAATPQTPDAMKLYSYAELAERFGKSKSTIRQWVCAGMFGEPIKVGNSTRVTQKGLDKYIADHSGPIKKQQPQARSRSARTPAPRPALSSMRL